MKPLLLSLSLASLTLLCHCATPSGSSSGNQAALTTATKEQPFVNSLGMKFVPVPGTNVLFCTTETTVAQYQQSGRSYQAPPFPQGSNHPAVRISWDDAQAWCRWLSKKEKQTYRLPTDAEWSMAVGSSTYPWGNQWPPPNHSDNYAGQELRSCSEIERATLFPGFNIIGGFSDRHKFTATVGSYPANGYGLRDLGGNVNEWCEDKVSSAAGNRVARGGCWQLAGRDFLRSSYRVYNPNDSSGPASGFRVVIER